jgi:hypothetical protein
MTTETIIYLTMHYLGVNTLLAIYVLVSTQSHFKTFVAILIGLPILLVYFIPKSIYNDLKTAKK